MSRKLKNKAVRSSLTTPKVMMMRQRVRSTAALIAPDGRISEEISDHWHCDLLTRTVYWRPTQTQSPHEVLTSDELLMITAHEAGHIRFTGGHSAPISPADGRAFQMFMNWVEDIRIERLLADRFPGFEPIRTPYSRKLLKQNWLDNLYQLPIHVAVPVCWMAKELAISPTEHPAWRFVRDSWPSVNLALNARSTADLVEMLYPVWNVLRQAFFLKDYPEWRHVAPEHVEAMAKKGSPHPSKHPVRSPIPQGGHLLDFDELEMLRELLKDLDPQHSSLHTKVQQRIKAEEEHRETEATGIATRTGGDLAKRSADSFTPDRWETLARELRPQIVTLRARFRSVLRNNAMANLTAGYRRGRISTHHMPRAVRGDNAIFRRPGEIGAHDYTVGVLLDASGSMSTDSKWKNACDALVILLEAVDDLAGFRSFAVTWADWPTALKPIDRELKPYRGSLIHMDTEANDGTYEAPALMAAADQLKRAPRTSKRMLIVLTDGQTSHPGESMRLVESIEEEGTVVITVGIGFTPLATARKKGSQILTVRNSAELTELLPRLVGSMMRKGGS